jgi:hypothetical protein
MVMLIIDYYGHGKRECGPRGIPHRQLTSSH